MLEGKQEEGLSSANDGFYESRREWMGRRHTILAFERYYCWSLLYFDFEIGWFCLGIDYFGLVNELLNIFFSVISNFIFL